MCTAGLGDAAHDDVAERRELGEVDARLRDVDEELLVN